MEARMKQEFRVGMQYRMLANRTSGWFWATCVKRTAKTATFASNENGSRWYMPEFTLRVPPKGTVSFPNGDIDEMMVTRKGAKSFPYGLTAYASEEREPKA